MYKWTKPHQHFSVEELAKLLIANLVPKEKVCSKQPVRVCRNVAFVVDLHSLDDPLDIHVDENRVWKRKGSPVAYVSLHTNSGKTTVFKHSRMGDHPNHYKLVRTYYRHNSSQCGPNLAAIANHGMPSGSGRKGGVAKRKRSRVTTPIQTRSVRQCLQQNSSPAPSFATLDSPRQQPNISAGFEQYQSKSHYSY